MGYDSSFFDTAGGQRFTNHTIPQLNENIEGLANEVASLKSTIRELTDVMKFMADKISTLEKEVFAFIPEQEKPQDSNKICTKDIKGDDHQFIATFGSDEKFPYQYGHVVVKAIDYSDATEIFRDLVPSRDENNTLNCAFLYTKGEWDKVVEDLRSRGHNSELHAVFYRNEQGKADYTGDKPFEKDIELSER